LIIVSLFLLVLLAVIFLKLGSSSVTISVITTSIIICPVVTTTFASAASAALLLVCAALLVATTIVISTTATAAKVGLLFLLSLISDGLLLAEFLLELLTELVDLHGPGLILLLGAFPALHTILKHVLDEHLDAGGDRGHAGLGGELVEAGEGLNDLVLDTGVGLLRLLKSLGRLTAIFPALELGKLLVDHVADLFHEHDSALHSVVIDVRQVSLLGLHTEEHVKDRDNNGLLEEFATEELTYELDVAQEAGLETEDFLLILALKELQGLLGEELVETGTAVRQQGLAEERASNVLLCSRKASKAKLQSDNFLAKLSIENAILLFVLSLSEDGLNDDLEVLLAQILVGKCRVQLFVVTWFSGRLKVPESVAAELRKLLLEIVGQDHVDDETDLLKNIFVTPCLFDSPFAFLDQLLAEKVGLLTLKLVVLGRGISLAAVLAVLGLSDTLLETIFALRIWVVVVVATAASSVAALRIVMSGLVSATLGEGRFLEFDQVGLAVQLSRPE
jgi:hypothetical protein